MKITAIKTYLLEKKLSSTMQISRGGFQVRHHTIVEVHTDAGITGLGEGVGNARLVKSLLDGQMASMVIGDNPMNIEVIRHKLMDSQVYFERKGSALCAASAIEMACWDIKGKALGVPVYQLLGGLYRDRLECYASECYWEEDPENMGRNAERMVESGFNTIKAHIGYGNPKSDLKRVESLRKSIGKDIGLMIDLNAGYNTIDAFSAFKLWQDSDLIWIEEPLNPNHVDAMADLRLKVNVPIASGENEFQVYGFKELFDKKAIDIAMPDIGRVGGIQETKNICTLAQAYGIPVSPHNYSSGILLAATMHVMASTPNTWMLEMDGSRNAVYEELLISPIELKNSHVTMPDHPGLGVKLSTETLEKYAIEQFTTND
jgi:L-alanine-DL-glutamate epimerase-like enolase superfamily enzyme